MTADLSADTRRKLVGVLGMLGSYHAGERDVAAQLANRIVRGAGLTWNELMPPRGWSRDPSRRALVHLHLRRIGANWHTAAASHPRWLSDWERDFLAGLSRWPRLSSKQTAILDRIALKLRSRGVAAVTGRAGRWRPGGFGGESRDRPVARSWGFWRGVCRWSVIRRLARRLGRMSRTCRWKMRGVLAAVVWLGGLRRNRPGSAGAALVAFLHRDRPPRW